MTQQICDQSINSLSAGQAARGCFASLPKDVLFCIISYLDLTTISRLSRASRFFLKLASSDDLWRRISKALVGLWIYRPHLISKQALKSTRPQCPPLPSDWTEDSNCVPVSHFIQSQSSSDRRVNQERFTSWHHFATRFIIPHFNFLGWHISNKPASSEIILVTYDIFSGQLILQEVKCSNLFDPICHQPEDPTVLGLSPGLPIDRIHLKPDGLHYKIESDIDSLSRGCIFQIFAPEYSTACLLTISLLQSRNASIQSQPLKKVYDWNDFILAKGIPKIRHADKIIVPRRSIVSRAVLAQDTLDLVTNPGVDSKQLQSFTLARGPDRRDCFPINGPIPFNDDQPRKINDGLWVGVNRAGRDERQVEFGLITLERQANQHLQIRFLKLTGGRPEFIWEAGVHYAKPIPAMGLDEALPVDFGISSVESRWLRGQGKIIGVVAWVDVEIQLIHNPNGAFDELNANQIRVKWSTDEKVINYYKVQFAS